MIQQTEIDTFKEDGVVVVRGLLDPAVVGQCLKAFGVFSESAEALDQVSKKDIVFESMEKHPKAIKYVQHVNYYLPVFNRLFGNALLDVARTLLGQEVYYDGIEIHDKVPHGGTLTPAHQDNFYFCLDPADALTAYVALETHNSTNGGLCFVKKSHLQGVQPHLKAKVKAFSSSLGESGFPEESVYRIDLKPGDVSFHHSNTIHFAAQNESEIHRRSASIRINGVKAKVSETMRSLYQTNLEFNRAAKDEPVTAS